MCSYLVLTLFKSPRLVMKRSMSSIAVTIPLNLCLLLVAAISLQLCYGSIGTPHCSPSEREALLSFKHDLVDPSKRLASWNDDGDCCGWYGVICNNLTGHIIELNLRSLSWLEYLASSATNDYEAYLRSLFGGKINISLINLKHLRFLDLSNNDFGGTQIPEFLGSMRNLRYLDLSQAGFGGKIPHQLRNLSNLHYLNLHDDSFWSSVDSLGWLSGLPSLEFLDLSHLNLVLAYDWLQVINTLPSLAELYFSDCNLPVPPLLNSNFSSLSILDLSQNRLYDKLLIPRWVSGIKSLTHLNLAGNHFQGPIPDSLQNLTSLIELSLYGNYFNYSVPDWLYGFKHLMFLDLGSNNLEGNLSNSIKNLTSLTSLDLSANKLEGRLPKSFKYLCNLRLLFLSMVKLSQEIAEVFEILSACSSNRLESLDLSYCQLFGPLTNDIGKLKQLESLELSSNSISGPIPTSLGEMESLKTLHFSHNKLNGTLPKSFGGLKNLEILHIFYNSLEGVVSEIQFSNLTKLEIFCATGNRLTLKVSPDWIPPLQIQTLLLGSWRIGSQFPAWVHSLKPLSSLELSNCGISSPIPSWFWNLSSNLLYLNLSHNQIHGVLPNAFNGFSNFPVIDLSSNHFYGPLPCFSYNVVALDLSNNSFSGSISNFLCYCYKMIEKRYMGILNLGDNRLSGEIPDCWMHYPNLVALKLSNNQFSGYIPWSFGSLTVLQSLNLRNNNLNGKIPSSLKNCTNLVKIDFGANELEGNIPGWMGEGLSSLVILNLHANKFYGHIPKELCLLASLQILDFARNNLFGAIPSCINNLSAMDAMNDSEGRIIIWARGASFMETALLVMKGKVVEYDTILQFVRSIDLSNNYLSREIPKEITGLGALQSLNLSQNLLFGEIPKDIGSMRSLECMDFSQNQLSGEIPQSMASLTFLSYLNLSNNHLRGRIPSSTQLQSFSSSSFNGNEELCGPPVTIKCDVDDDVPKIGNVREKDDNVLEVYLFHVSIALGFGVGFWTVVGPLIINRRWRERYFFLLDRMGDKIYWSFK